jgi:hypothetical protein
MFEKYARGDTSFERLGSEYGIPAEGARKIIMNPIYNGWAVRSSRRHGRGRPEERVPARWRDNPPVSDELWGGSAPFDGITTMAAHHVGVTGSILWLGSSTARAGATSARMGWTEDDAISACIPVHAQRGDTVAHIAPTLGTGPWPPNFPRSPWTTRLSSGSFGA